MKNENGTVSILQRVSMILAVTAASYGLAQTQAPRSAPAPQLTSLSSPAQR